MGKLFDENKTFLLCVLSLAFSFWGAYVNLFEPTLFKELLWVILPAYTAKSIGGKFAKGYINKHNKADHSVDA